MNKYLIRGCILGCSLLISSIAVAEGSEICPLSYFHEVGLDGAKRELVTFECSPEGRVLAIVHRLERADGTMEVEKTYDTEGKLLFYATFEYSPASKGKRHFKRLVYDADGNLKFSIRYETKGNKVLKVGMYDGNDKKIAKKRYSQYWPPVYN